MRPDPATSPEARATPVRRRRPRRGEVVVHRVPYAVYVQLLEVETNRHLKMAFHDGTLEIASPHFWMHEVPTVWLSTVVKVVAGHLGLPFQSSRSATFRRGGPGIYAGKGKEPDEGFYFANLGRLPRDRAPDLDAGDPPPDLWIEVDHRVSSAGRLPVYAALGVPEVWRYRSKARTLRFLGLVDTSDEIIEASASLPMLTPALVLEALAPGDRTSDSAHLRTLRSWDARTFPRPADG